MTPIEERRAEMGAEFTEVDCYTCRNHMNLPELLFMKHNGYGTGQFPPQTEIDAGYNKARAHNQKHEIVIFIGKG